MKMTKQSLAMVPGVMALAVAAWLYLPDIVLGPLTMAAVAQDECGSAVEDSDPDAFSRGPDSTGSDRRPAEDGSRLEESNIEGSSDLQDTGTAGSPKKAESSRTPYAGASEDEFGEKSSRKKSTRKEPENSRTKGGAGGMSPGTEAMSGRKSAGSGEKPRKESSKKSAGTDNSESPPRMDGRKMMPGMMGPSMGGMRAGYGGSSDMWETMSNMMRGAGAAAPTSDNPRNFEQGKSVVISINDSGDTLFGYSVATGKWTHLKITPFHGQRPRPLVSTDVGAFLTDDAIYAYSSKTGKWGTLKTANSRNARVDEQQILLEENKDIHIFSNVTGEWTSSNTLMRDQTPGIGTIPLPSHNPLATTPVLRDSQGRAVVIGEFDSSGDLGLVLAEPLDPEIGSRLRAQDVLDSLKARADAAEQKLVELTHIYRGGAENAQRVQMNRAQLESAVREVFDARQQSQRMEAEILRVRLLRIDQRLAEREQTKAQIIARRLEHLMSAPDPFGASPKEPMPAGRMPRHINRTGSTNPFGISAVPGGGKSTEPGDTQIPDAGSSVVRPGSGIPGMATNEDKMSSNSTDVPPKSRFPSLSTKAKSFQTVGIITRIEPTGKVYISMKEPGDIQIGHDLIVSRLDFVHEDGTAQFYNFARLVVVHADVEQAIGVVLEINRKETPNGYVNEELATGQRASVELRNHADAMSTPLEQGFLTIRGQWQLERWVRNQRVLPPGDLKGARYILVATEHAINLIDPINSELLHRFQPSENQNPRGFHGAFANAPSSTSEDGTNRRIFRFRFEPVGGRPIRSRGPTDGTCAFEVNGNLLRIGEFRADSPEDRNIEPGAGINYMEFTRLNSPSEGSTDDRQLRRPQGE
jgi:hypothetical protein